MIEAKKLAYADMLRYVGDPRFGQAPVAAMLDKAHARERAGRIDSAMRRARRPAVGLRRPDQRGRQRHDLSLRHRPARQHRLADSEHLRRLRHRDRPARHRLRAAQPRRALHARRDASQRARAAQAAAAHDHPGVHAERRRRASASGSWAASTRPRPTRSSSRTSWTTDSTSSRRSRPGRFTKPTFTGADVNVEALVPESVRDELTRAGARRHDRSAAHGNIRLRTGGDERRLRRAFRRVGAAARRRGDS